MRCHRKSPLRFFATALIAFTAVIFSLIPLTGKADESQNIVKTDKFEGVIIPREMAADFMKAFSGFEEREVWTPDRASVLKMEEKIDAYLKKAALKRSPALWSKLAKYKRQYVGVVRNNQRLIFSNFFCDAFDVDWKTKPIAVEDGGDCFFTVLYDPASAAFSELRINGEA
jgi:hypothetical protein